MLEGLDKINWSQLHHAFGNASNVPSWIRALLSDNKQTRESAIYELSENLQHQGTVYEASFYVVPFLLELLKSPVTPDKAEIAMLLADMGNNSGGTHYEFSGTDDKVVERNVEKGKRYAESIRLAIREERQLLYLYLHHEVYSVRAVVAHALQAFPELSEEIIPLLKKTLESENDTDVRETIEDSIRMLSKPNQ